MFWIVLANTNQFRIFEYQKKTHQLTLLKEGSHPEAKLRDIDLVSDRQGHYKTRDPSRGSFSEHTDPKENEIDHFLSALAKELDTGRMNHSYEQLIIISPPEVIGMLHPHLNKNVANLITTTINKDYIIWSDKELATYLKEHWRELAK